MNVIYARKNSLKSRHLTFTNESIRVINLLQQLVVSTSHSVFPCKLIDNDDDNDDDSIAIGLECPHSPHIIVAPTQLTWDAFN